MKQTILSLLLASAALPAMAADMPLKAPPARIAPVTDWTGFYIGVHGGYGWGRDPFVESDLAGISADFQINGIKSKGFVIGGQFGHNWQWGSWVGGVEIDVSSTGIKGSSSRSLSGTIEEGVTVTETRARNDKFDMLGSARGRLGFLPTQNFWLYGTGGLAWTQFTQGETDTSVTSLGTQSITDTETAEHTDWRFGFAVGAGGEYKVTENLLLRVEYLHYDFGKAQPSQGLSLSCVNVTGCPAFSVANTSGRLTTDVVRGALSWRFGYNQ